MNIDKIKSLLIPYLEKNHLELYEVSFRKEDGNLILQVLIDQDQGISIDQLAECNEFLSSQLDAIDQDMPEYFLEVSSPGAEKQLRNMDEIMKYIHSYIHVEVDNMIYEGILESVDDGILSIRYNAKGRFRTVKLPYGEIHFIRLAVKI